MAFLRAPHVRIAGISAAVPKQVSSNHELTALSTESKELLIQTTGIKTRRIAPSSITTSDLCFAAADKLLNDLNWDRNEIEVLILVTQTPDQPIPGSSMLLQNHLGLPKTCMAMDLNQGCAGYVYGLATMMGLIATSELKKGLLLVGDTITHVLEKDDLSTIPIFSDAGTATALEFDLSVKESLFNLQTDGEGCDAIHQKKGESMKMNGHAVFHFGLKEVVPNVNATLEKAGVSIDELDYAVFHQANLLLNESIRKKLKIPAEKVPYTLAEFGNTSCATIPFTLVKSLRTELENTSKTCLISGFGVGLSWGSGILHLSNCVCPELIEME